MDLLPLLIALVVGVALGAVIGMLVARSRVAAGSPALLEARHSALVSDLRTQEADARAALQAELAAAQASLGGLREQLATAQEHYRDAMERARVEADKRTQDQQTGSKVLEALAPVKASLSSMELKVTELETQRSRQHGELAQQLKSAAESEERLRATADSLAAALKNNATRGVWGETQLRSVVEAAGMLQHVNFDLQSSIQIDSRSARPDMVIRLPGGKSIAVDAKVPFNAYIDASAISTTAHESELARRETLLKAHVKAVRDHIAALSSKSYWDGLESSPETVVAFIPSEALLAAAVDSDPSIMQYALERNVVLASPMTLFLALKTAALTWRHDDVSREAKALFDVSRELYGRLTTLATHVDKLGRSIERSVKDYNSFVGSLERQVLPSARRLSQLDESKVLPVLSEIEEDTREITMSDLTAQMDREQGIAREFEEVDKLDGVARGELDLPELPSARKPPKTA